MHVSASEIESTLQKATIGLGLGIGCGVEAGRSALTMGWHDVDPAPIFLAAFDKISSGLSIAYDNACAFGGVFAPNQAETHLSAIMAAPAICDFLTVGKGQLVVESVDSPIIVLMSLLSRGLDIKCERLGEKREVISSKAGKLRYENGGIEGSINSSSLKLTYIADFERNLMALPTGELKVDVDAWSELLGYAERCLVVGSEQSRLMEAGAGLIDED
jgi:hypothetical protein